MKKNFTLIFLIALFGVFSATQAQELFSEPIDSLPLGDLAEQANWSVTKHMTEAYGTMRISASDLAPDEKFIEIVNDNSMLASQTRPPLNAGIFEFKAKHNKSGLFYLYAQTSDNGGQLLFSIQFTEAKGILLEKADKQITLLPDYNSDQWYWFTIDFDNARGDNGTFTLQIDGQNLGEYEYVESESELFDLAQITIGSESAGKTAISGFADTFSVPVPAATSTVSDALLLLSISLSSTSISSNLENGLIVTATLDGIAGVATSSITDTATSAEAAIEISSSTTEAEGSTVGSFIMDIIDSVIEIFSPEDETATSTEPTLPEPTEATSTPVETIPIPVEPVIEVPVEDTPLAEPAPENEIQSSVSTEDVTNNETITTEF